MNRDLRALLLGATAGASLALSAVNLYLASTWRLQILAAFTGSLAVFALAGSYRRAQREVSQPITIEITVDVGRFLSVSQRSRQTANRQVLIRQNRA